MKYFRNTLLTLAVFAVVLGGYFLYEKYFKNKLAENQEADTQEQILSVDKNRVSEIVVQYNGDELIFVKDNNDMVLSKPSNIRTDKQVITSLQSTIAGLFAQSRIGNIEKERYSDFGLEKPNAKVSIKQAEEVKEIIIGDKTPSGSAYYAKVSNIDMIYTIDFVNALNLMVDVDKVRNKKAFGLNAEDVDYFYLQNNGQTLFELMFDREKDKRWVLKQPMEALCDDTKVKALINSANNISIKEYIKGTAEDMAQYGLDNPVNIIEIVSNATSKIKLLIGKEKVKGEEVYAKYYDSKEVFVINMDTFDFGNKRPEDLISKEIQNSKVQDVVGLKLSGKDGARAFKITSGTKDDLSDYKIYLNNVEITQKDAFKNMFTELVNLEADLLALYENPKGVSYLQVVFEHNKYPGVVTIDFVVRDEGSYYVLRNGKYLAQVINKDKLNKIEALLQVFQIK